MLRTEIDCEVHTASDRAEARALLECHAYSLAAVDLSFTPGRLEGLDIIEDLASALFRPYLLAYSEDEQNRALALSKGADVFLEKICLQTEIASIVQNFIDDPESRIPRLPNSSGRLLLDELLGPNGTRVYVQPIYGIENTPALLKAVEFLSRGPANSPFERADVLFAYARAIHMENVLDRHCIQRALAVATLLPPDIRFSVNVHPSTLCSPPDFAAWFSESAKAAEIDVSRATIEIVEHATSWNRSTLLQTLKDLRSLGVKIALDDIGTGHSNYQMILDTRPDRLKLDRYFVKGCSTDRFRKAIVASVARLAADIGSTVIAEGVDTFGDLQELKNQDINLVQSFMFCPPVSVNEALASVLANSAKACHCSLEQRENKNQCALKGLGLCLPDYPKQNLLRGNISNKELEIAGLEICKL